MAAGLFKNFIKQRPDAFAWRVESAGTWCREGLPAASMSQYVLRQRGIDISAHRSRMVSRDLLLSFNLILVMEQGHKEALRVEFPQIVRRVHMISEMINLRRNIADPMGGSVADFLETMREFDHIFLHGMETILRLSTRVTGVLRSDPTVPIPKK